jgi:hypothetical protein
MRKPFLIFISFLSAGGVLQGRSHFLWMYSYILQTAMRYSKPGMAKAGSKTLNTKVPEKY